MNDRDRRRYDMLQRVKQFGLDNAADFPGGSIGAMQFAVVTARLADADAQGASQDEGIDDAGLAVTVKGTAREDLRDLMSDISRTARSMQYQFDGIDEQFRMPRNASDQNLLAAGRAFHTNSGDFEADFITYGMPAGFRADLEARCDGFEGTFGAVGTATDMHVAATAEIAETIRLGVRAVRILDGVVRNVYAGSTGKTAAWASASHVERDPT